MSSRDDSMRAAAAIPLICMILATAVPLRADTLFYVGSPFASVFGDYDTTMAVSGSVAFSAAVLPNQPFQDMANLVTSYSFSDGVQTLTESNSFIRKFHLATDDACRLSRWEIAFWQLDLHLVNGLDLFSSEAVAADDAFVHAPCGHDGAPCLFVVVTEARHFGIGESTSPVPWSEPAECFTSLFVDGFESEDPGNWSEQSP